MGRLKYWNRINIIGLTVMSELFLSSVRAEGFLMDYEKALIEDSLYRYSKGLDGAIWKWNFPEKICDRLCYKLLYFDRSELEIRDVLLETQDDTKIRMEVLKCFYKLYAKTNISLQIKFSLTYVRGVNGEIYEVSLPAQDPQRPDDSPPLTVTRCVHPGSKLRFDVSDIEKYFYDNRKSITHRAWGVLDSRKTKTCELLGPTGLQFSEMGVGRLDVVLESQNCTRISIEVLTCHYQNQISNRFVNYYVPHLDFAKGDGNDVYEILPSLETEICDGDQNLVIARRVIDDEGKVVVPLCPQ